MMEYVCMFGEKVPKTKYREARLVYAKQRRPKNSETRKIRRRLIRLIEKITVEWRSLNRITGGLITLTAEQRKRTMACSQVLEQQRVLSKGGKVDGRVVSIDRPYIPTTACRSFGEDSRNRT
ncbi:MAG: hypothetical protein HDS27_00025 [Bacteroides sp.]|nr:hypothetical protein [Bacteroides sp.]